MVHKRVVEGSEIEGNVPWVDSNEAPGAGLPKTKSRTEDIAVDNTYRAFKRVTQLGRYDLADPEKIRDAVEKLTPEQLGKLGVNPKLLLPQANIPYASGGARKMLERMQDRVTPLKQQQTAEKKPSRFLGISRDKLKNFKASGSYAKRPTGFLAFFAGMIFGGGKYKPKGSGQ